MKLYPLIFLAVAAALVCYGYAAMTGPVAPGVRVWWAGMVGPFVIAAIAHVLVHLVSGKYRNWVSTSANVYAIVLSVAGLLVAAVLFRGANDAEQNHSDYGLFFVALWAIALPVGMVLFGAALWKRTHGSSGKAKSGS